MPGAAGERGCGVSMPTRLWRPMGLVLTADRAKELADVRHDLGIPLEPLAFVQIVGLDHDPEDRSAAKTYTEGTQRALAARYARDRAKRARQEALVNQAVRDLAARGVTITTVAAGEATGLHRDRCGLLMRALDDRGELAAPWPGRMGKRRTTTRESER